MKRARKVSNVHAEVNFKQKQRLTIAFTGNTLPHGKLSCKGAEDFITMPPRNHNQSKQISHKN